MSRRGNRRVTICIAAACEAGHEHEQPRIVICSDMLLTSTVAVADVAFKNRFLVGGWHLSFACDDITEEHATSLHIRRVFAEHQFGTVDETNIASLMEEAFARRNREIARNIAMRDFGVSYAKLRRMARGGLPAVSASMEEIRAWRPERKVDYIISGVHHGLPYMLEYFNGVPTWRDEWAIVGAGQDAADKVLQEREQTPVSSLMRTILAVYEAKKAAEAADQAIGPKTVIFVQHEGEQSRGLSEEFLRDVLEPLRIEAQHLEKLADLPHPPPPEAYIP